MESKNNKNIASENKHENKLTAFEKAVLNNCSKDRKMTYEINGKKFTFNVKNHIDLDYRREILDSVEGIYFRDGNYNKALGDTVMENLILTLYTDITFGDDLPAFDEFRAGKDYPLIIRMLPDEVSRLWNSINDKIEFLKPMYNGAIEQKRVNDAFSSLLAEGVKLFEHIENAMDSVAGIAEGTEKFKMTDLLSALTKLEAKDEAKIAKAVLDFQEEKAKRVAAATKEGKAD